MRQRAARILAEKRLKRGDRALIIAVAPLLLRGFVDARFVAGSACHCRRSSCGRRGRTGIGAGRRRRAAALDTPHARVEIDIHIALTLGIAFNAVVHHLDLTAQALDFALEGFDLIHQLQHRLTAQRLFNFADAPGDGVGLRFQIIDAPRLLGNLLARHIVVEHARMRGHQCQWRHQRKKQRGSCGEDRPSHAYGLHVVFIALEIYSP